MSIEELRKYITQWNNRFPYDHWWREKHGIPFLSKEHREANFLFQRMEYEEDKMITELRSKKENDETYIPNIGDIFKTQNIVGEDAHDSFLNEAKYELDNLPEGL